MSFDPNQYWLERGKTYRFEQRLNSEFYREQERFIVDVVKEVSPTLIYEVGCGFGRITRELAALDVTIIATDLSDDQLSAARDYIGAGVCLKPFDLTSEQLMPCCDGLLMAIEVLLHHPAAVVQSFIVRALNAFDRVLHDFDPNAKLVEPTAEHCFTHDYQGMYRKLGIPFREFTRGPHGLILAG